MISIFVLALAVSPAQQNGVKKPPIDSTKPVQPPSSQPGEGVKPYNPGMPDFDHPKVPNPDKPMPAPKKTSEPMPAPKKTAEPRPALKST